MEKAELLKACRNVLGDIHSKRVVLDGMRDTLGELSGTSKTAQVRMEDLLGTMSILDGVDSEDRLGLGDVAREVENAASLTGQLHGELVRNVNLAIQAANAMLAAHGRLMRTARPHLDAIKAAGTDWEE